MKSEKNEPRPAAPARPKDSSLRLSSGSESENLERRLDEALEETFPASDPIAVTPRDA